MHYVIEGCWKPTIVFAVLVRTADDKVGLLL